MPLLAYPRLFFGKGKTSAARQFGKIALLKGQFCYKIALREVQFLMFFALLGVQY